MSNWRIGAVSYLNTKPLVHKLADRFDDRSLVFDLPSRLADRLALGELDVALVPSIELFLHPEYAVVSDACIACRGPVWSVKLMSRVPFERIQTLALDEGSRTSAILVQILLAEQFQVEPELLPLEIDATWNRTRADATLIIGDRAMRACSSVFPHQLDLGAWWYRWTRMPFVFALWAARPHVDFGELDAVLSGARDGGLENIEAIAREEAAKYDLSMAECLTYFQKHLHFRLGDEERKGMELFCDRYTRFQRSRQSIAGVLS